MDVVPCHTSIEHPWFREHPDWYVWSDRDGPQNNWIALVRRPGVVARRADAAAGTCTRSIPSSPTSTGATRRCARRWPASLRFWTRARRRRLPPRRDRPADEGPRAARRPAGRPGRRRCRSTPSTRRSSTATRATRPTSATRSPRCARAPATRSSSARSTCRRTGLRPVPRAPRPRVRVRALPRALGRRRASARRSRRRSTRRARPAASPGCSRTTTSRACPTRVGRGNERAAALLALTLPGDRLRLPGRRDRHGQRPGRRPAGRPLGPRRATATRCGGATTSRTAASPRASRGCRRRRSPGGAVAEQERRPRRRCCTSTAT